MADTQASGRRRPLRQQIGCIAAIVLTIVLVVGAIWVYLSLYQGRDISRLTGIPVKIALPECVTSRDQIISISFHNKANGETVKDVTYVCDGRMYSHEYNDFGILQGTIEWTFLKKSGSNP